MIRVGGGNKDLGSKEGQSNLSQGNATPRFYWHKQLASHENSKRDRNYDGGHGVVGSRAVGDSHWIGATKHETPRCAPVTESLWRGEVL